MGKFTAAEAREIMAKARATVRQVEADQLQWAEDRCRWETEALRQREGADRLVVKTVRHARVPAPDPAPAPAQAAEWPVDVIFDTVGQAVGKLLDKVYDDFELALARRDREIKALGDRIEIEVGLSRKLVRAQAAIDRARKQQPNFEAELNGLREKIAKHEKTITRLRGEQSTLEYRQGQLDAEQQKNRHEVRLTAVEITSVGSATRAVLERLRENGVDFIEEWLPSGLAS
jgi:hypothetical protein